MNYTSNKDYDVSGRASIITEGVCDLGFHHIKCGKDRGGIQRWRGAESKYKRAGGYIKDSSTILAGVVRERFFKSLMGIKKPA